jgi:hypothetical protein
LEATREQTSHTLVVVAAALKSSSIRGCALKATLERSGARARAQFAADVPEAQYYHLAQFTEFRTRTLLTVQSSGG